MDITQSLENWLKEAEFAENIAFQKLTPARGAVLEPFPASILPSLQQILSQRGITALYSHQAEALRYLEEGENIVISTGTSSGKSLC